MKPSLVLAAVLATAALSNPSPSAAQEREFRIGALGTFTGAFGVIGESMRRGAELAAEMRGNQVLGVPVRFTWEDDETKPQVAVQKATRLTSEKVHVLYAPVSSASTLAVMKVAEREKTPLLVTLSALDDIANSNGNPYTFRTSNSQEMETRMLLRFIEEKRFTKIYIAASDYKAGRDAIAAMRKRLEGKGVSIVGEDYIPIGARDYSIIVNKVAQSDAQAFYVGVAGNDLISLLKQADQVKLQEKKTLFGQIVMDELLGKATGPAALGIYSALRYHFSVDNAANKAFVAAFRKKYGEFPDQYAGEAFDGVAWFLDVVDATKVWDKEKWLAAFRASKRPQSVEGTKAMRTCDNQAEQPGFYGKAVKGEGELPAVTMQILYRFEAKDLMTPCP